MHVEFYFSEMKIVLEICCNSNVNITNTMNCMLKNGEDDKFYVTSVLPQFLKNLKRHKEKAILPSASG